MKIVMVLASIAQNAERTDGAIAPTLMHRAGTGGGQLPILILRSEEDKADASGTGYNNENVQSEQP